MKKIIVFFALVIFLSCSKDKEEIPELYPETENAFFEVLNVHRDTLGMNLLIVDSSLTELARVHSRNMATELAINHDGSSNRKNSVFNMGYNSFGENVAKGGSINSIVFSWLNSPDHKDNIEGNFTHTGIGVSQGNDNFYYVTQIFAK